ncbi:hypothetical protein [Brevibacillus dissolubilis]|uniref:hypothetical protein n=1 Tax=Brevibacillus dissolubilis TaxID=1844116 RepID=UPI001116B050|nr:hypothetical protein [Brevibacillus dissolubilis]
MVADIVVWLLAAYGCSALLVSLCHFVLAHTLTPVAEPCVHYQLLLRNSEQSLEMVMRGLLFRASMSGRPIRISFVDEGSHDYTGKMTEIYQRTLDFLIADPAAEDGSTITIDLRNA